MYQVDCALIRYAQRDAGLHGKYYDFRENTNRLRDVYVQLHSLALPQIVIMKRFSGRHQACLRKQDTGTR